MKWETPKSPTEIRSFFGLAGYYHRFIQDFSKIAVPLTKLTRKNVGFAWEKEQQSAFEMLRQKLCEALVLTLPEGVEDMPVYCDSLYHGLGCILMQHEKVISYASRQLKTHEVNYPTHDLELARYVEKCLTCLRVKAEHQRPHRKLQPLDIPVWKWEHITMDLITKLPRTPWGFDAIWVIVDRLTKSAHFMLIRESSSSEVLADIYVKEIVARHGVPITIFSNRDVWFTSRFWSKFHEDMGTRLKFSTSFHLQTDGQSERTI
ncbi:hypothetical protein OSB04_un000316 [Centaurea solstitialis]|uniref:Integrase catalytic domain-containing protein n=1 Tax=Centaurea solstitialis TaxID=347529 RepID=A0AA38W3R7_9ASTR|nr:hypothetical protein OSB04_un000316 [Centaurea solstitialis]